jgi:hypothetical protein
MKDLQRLAVDEPVCRGVRRDLDPQSPPANGESDRQPGDTRREAGSERQGTLSFAQAGESRHQGDPGSRQRSDMQAVAGVVLEIVEIHEGSLGQVVVSQGEVPDFGRQHRLGAGRQR